MSLNPLMVEELDEIEEMQEQQRFQVTDLQSLTWVFRKLAAIEAKRNEVNQVADAEVVRIEMYRRREMDKLQRDTEYFHGVLGEYALNRRNDDPKFKSEKTPYGSLTFKKQQPKWNYDDQQLTEWLQGNGHTELIRTKIEPNKVEIKKQFWPTPSGDVVDADGQIVSGIQIEYRGDELVIKPEV